MNKGKNNIIIQNICILWYSSMQLSMSFAHDRWKFRRQISDNIDKWSSRGGKSPRWERNKKEDPRREAEEDQREKSAEFSRKKSNAHEKVEKSRDLVCFQCLVVPGGRKVVGGVGSSWVPKKIASYWHWVDLNSLEGHTVISIRH